MTNQTVSKNKVVQFTYTIKDEQGNIIEKIDAPVQYMHGAGNLGLIDIVEKSLTDTKVGDTIEVKVLPEDSFGEPNPSLIFDDDLKNIPPEYQKIGSKVELTNDKGDKKEFAITKIEGEKVTFDGNHPLAGITVLFIVDIVSIRDASPEELKEDASGKSSAIVH